MEKEDYWQEDRGWMTDDVRPSINEEIGMYRKMRTCKRNSTLRE